MSEQHEETVYDHLNELRKRILWSAVTIVLTIGFGIYAAKPIIMYLQHAGPVDVGKLHVFSPWDGISIYMNVALAVAILIGSPILLWQLWLFVSPGLKIIERKAVVRYLPYVFILGLSGAAFAFYVVFPLAFRFSTSVIGALDMEETFGIAEYFSFMFSLVIPMALLFQLPIVVMFLTRIGLLNPQMLTKVRKVAYFVLYLVATIVTPPDFISDFIVAVPLILLYEISIWISTRTYRKLNR